MQRIFSIGHSTRSLDELLALLGAHGVVQVADVRAVPASQRHPQFTRAHLEVALPAAGVAYRWLPGLGGKRQPGPAPSPNTAWRDAAFRAYADHMATAAFAAARQELEAWARARPTACMCAEADWRRCHRQLLADALHARGWEVRHIESATQAPAHVLPPFACRGTDGRVTYPGPPQFLL